MLLSDIRVEYQKTQVIVSYPLLRQKTFDHIDFPNCSFIMKPIKVAVLEEDRGYLTMSFSTVNYKSLFQKLLFFKSQGRKMQQDRIYQHIMHIYIGISELHAENELLGAVSIQQLFYQEQTGQIFIAGFLNNSIKPQFPIIYHNEAQVTEQSDALSIAYFAYCMFTQRFPPIPFLCDYELPRNTIDTDGNFNFCKFLFSKRYSFNELRDQNVCKFCEKQRVELPESESIQLAADEEIEEILAMLKDLGSYDQAGLIALLTM